LEKKKADLSFLFLLLGGIWLPSFGTLIVLSISISISISPGKSFRLWTRLPSETPETLKTFKRSSLPIPWGSVDLSRRNA
jgi:hypothetical protein